MKVVGHRAVEGRPLKDAEILLRTASRLQGRALVPKGLYRFETHEGADTWMIQTIARTHALRRSKTSSASADP